MNNEKHQPYLQIYISETGTCAWIVRICRGRIQVTWKPVNKACGKDSEGQGWMTGEIDHLFSGLFCHLDSLFLSQSKSCPPLLPFPSLPLHLLCLESLQGPGIPPDALVSRSKKTPVHSRDAAILHRLLVTTLYPK